MLRITLYSLLIFFTIGCKSRIKIEDVTAENLYDVLQPSKKSFDLSHFGLSSFQPWYRYTNREPIGLLENEIYEVDKTKPTADNSFHINLKDKATGTLFDFLYYQGKLSSLEVSRIRRDFSFKYDPIPYGMELIDYLIKEKGFQYKKTSLKSNADLLIKEYDKNEFLVCNVLLDENDQPATFIFRILIRK